MLLARLGMSVASSIYKRPVRVAVEFAGLQSCLGHQIVENWRAAGLWIGKGRFRLREMRNLSVDGDAAREAISHPSSRPQGTGASAPKQFRHSLTRLCLAVLGRDGSTITPASRHCR